MEDIEIHVARYKYSSANNVTLSYSENDILVNCGNVVYFRKSITGIEDDGVALPNCFCVGRAYNTLRAIYDIKNYVSG